MDMLARNIYPPRTPLLSSSLRDVLSLTLPESLTSTEPDLTKYIEDPGEPWTRIRSPSWNHSWVIDVQMKFCRVVPKKEDVKTGFLFNVEVTLLAVSSRRRAGERLERMCCSEYIFKPVIEPSVF